MKVLILGFCDKQEIDIEMEKLIAGSGCYLFTVVTSMESKNEITDWAEMRGCPLERINARDPHYLVWYCDFILVKLSEETPQWVKNLIMEFKKSGKHGRVI